MFNTTYHKLCVHTKTKKIYDILYTAQHSETKEPLVIYKRVKLTENTPNTVWARPLKMFNSDVNINGKLCPRFDWLPDEFNTIKCPICLAKELKKYCEEHDLIFE